MEANLLYINRNNGNYNISRLPWKYERHAVYMPKEP